MIITAWKNGKHSETRTAYGVRLSVADRDEFIQREWKSVLLEVWLWDKGLAPWPKYLPPKLLMECISDNQFFIQQMNPSEES